MKWIRLWPDHILNGSTLDELDPGQRGVWFTLLVLAGYSPVPGTICLARGVAYTHEQMAAVLKINEDYLISTIQYLAHKEIEKIIINPDKTISIKNWNRYQSEYERQKPYRFGFCRL